MAFYFVTVKILGFKDTEFPGVKSGPKKWKDDRVFFFN